MSKKNPWHWYYGIPEFHTAHRFVYLNDLSIMRQQKNYDIYLKKLQLYTDAKNAAENIANDLQSKVRISNALDFLANVAENERQKELRTIKDYEKDLRQLLPDDDPMIDKILSKINANILDDPDEITEFYLYLTKYINETRQKAEEYKQRLESLLAHNEKEMSELQKDDYRFRASGDIRSGMRNIIGIATTAQERIENSFASQVRHLATDYLIQSGLIDKLESGEDIAAAFVAITLDVEKQFQDLLDKTGKTDFIELTEQEIEKLSNQYIFNEHQKSTNLQKAIQSDTDALNNILIAAKSILNIHSIESDSIKRSRIGQVSYHTRQLDDSLYLKLLSSSNNEAIKNLRFIEFSSMDTSTIHGNIFELIQVVQNGNTLKVVGKGGVDTLHLGSAKFNIETPDIQKQLREPFRNIEHIITKYVDEKRNGRMNDRTKAYTQMNKDITKTIDILNKRITALKINLQNLFVYHESLKLYKSMETNEANAFHGRDILILNYLDQLYSANNLAELELPHKDGLTFLSLNLGTETIGEEYKSSLENYLSIFAGLLMFDDVYNMAKEAQINLNKNKFTSSRVKQIHLYNLNGVYVPASMVLTFTYTCMKEIANEIESGYAAKVSISTNSANKAINEYLNNRPLPLKQQWFNLSENVSSGTNIRIIFLSSFVQLINELNEI